MDDSIKKCIHVALGTCNKWSLHVLCFHILKYNRCSRRIIYFQVLLAIFFFIEAHLFNYSSSYIQFLRSGDNNRTLQLHLDTMIKNLAEFSNDIV